MQKGQTEVAGLVKGALTVLVFIVIVAVGATLLQSYKSAVSDQTFQGNFSIDNQTFTGVLANSSNYFSFASGGVTPRTQNIARIVNTSNGVVLSTTSYALINGTAWNLTNATFQSTVAGNLSVQYVYDHTLNTISGNVTDQGLTAVDTYSDWFVIIVIIVIMAAVIGLLIRSFLGSQRFA